MFLRWCLTVCSLIENFCAISRFVPSDTIAETTSKLAHGQAVFFFVVLIFSAAGNSCSRISTRSVTFSCPTQNCPLSHGPNTCQKDLRRRILQNDALGAELQGLCDLFFFDRSGKHNRANRCGSIAKLTKSIEACQSRHDHIQEKNVGVQLLESASQCLLAVDRFADNLEFFFASEY